MGIYRLTLAYLVVFGHTHPPLWDSIGLGVSAVISFFLLSGFVMTALIKKYYFAVSSVPAFYLERFLRLAPQFYFYTIVTFVGVTFFGLRHAFMQSEPSAKSLILQFGLVPLDFYRYFPTMLLPQAWSLGLEVLFYAAFPFLLLKGLRLSAAVLSLLVYCVAYLGYVDTDLWGYRYLPGTLFMFICGSFLHSTESRKEAYVVWLVLALSIVLFGLTFMYPFLASLYNRSVLVGLIIGIPLVSWLKPRSHESGAGFTVDRIAGNLSYGVFLSHMLVIGIMETYFDVKFGNLGFWEDVQMTLTVFSAATLFGYLSFKFLESPLVSLRRKGRQRQLVINNKLGALAEAK